jgi:hypothetical protein
VPDSRFAPQPVKVIFQIQSFGPCTGPKEIFRILEAGRMGNQVKLHPVAGRKDHDLPDRIAFTFSPTAEIRQGFPNRLVGQGQFFSQLQFGCLVIHAQTLDFHAALLDMFGISQIYSKFNNRPGIGKLRIPPLLIKA